jgi:hypothetical protein
MDLQGWGSTDTNFRKLIDEINPKFIIEVGTWKGGSAIFMGEYIKEKNLDCKIICVDTWLGAIEFMENQNDPDRYLSLQMRNGYPSVYYQFLANVMHKGLEEIIIPFPQTATLASRFLTINHVKADMIYIDGSHDEKDVYDDINNYWELLNLNGIILGDDYDEYWPGVKLAVNNFVTDNELDITFTERQWVVKKIKTDINKSSYSVHQKARENKILALEYERDLFLYRKKFYDKEFLLSELSKVNENHENEIHDLHKTVCMLHSERDQSNSEKSEWRRRIETLETEINNFHQAIDALNVDRERVNFEKRECENRIQTLEGELNSYHQINDTLDSEKSQCLSSIENLEKEIRALRNSRSWKVTKPMRKIRKILQ